ncbi:MAG: SDR family oxidoreductase [Tissierellia bacterium]|nr:SDR family oxidoreductase [Tissierellia bacterium]
MIYVITGASSGIGKKTKEILEEKGHQVVNVDYVNGDVSVDLSKKEDRQRAIEEIIEKTPDGFDGLILNAGIGAGAEAKKMWAVNFFAPISLLNGLYEHMKKRSASVVVTASNTITNEMLIRDDWVDLLVNTLDEDRVLEYAESIDRRLSPKCYSSGKKALAIYVRRNAGRFGTDKMRINAVAPGNTTTPMTENMTDKQWEKALLIPIPTRYGKREFLDAKEIANVISFLALPESSGVNGAIFFVDGGIDGLLRSERF